VRVFAIGDLHMPGGDDKPMDVFGDHWKDHVAQIFSNWRERVGDEDVVLIPGDLTWAMQLSDAVPDLVAIGALPGRKLISKGNHDYWWSTLKQVRNALPEGMDAVQHTAHDLGMMVVTGTRGWSFPTEEAPLPQDEQKVFERELIRLELGLKAAAKMANGRPIVVMLHYPPLYDQQRDTAFTQLLEKFPVHTVVYGHLHGPAIHAGFTGEHNGIRYMLVSSDSLRFVPAEIIFDENDLHVCDEK